MDKQTTINGFIELKDVDIDPYKVIAYGKMPVPATLQTQEMYALSIWLDDVPAPIIITYTDEAERDAEFITVRTAIAGR